MLQLSKVFEGHEFVIRFRSPRINLNRILESNHKEFDSFIFDNTEVDCALQFTYVYPAISPFCLLELKHISFKFMSKYPCCLWNDSKTYMESGHVIRN